MKLTRKMELIKTSIEEQIKSYEKIDPIENTYTDGVLDGLKSAMQTINIMLED